MAFKLIYSPSHNTFLMLSNFSSNRMKLDTRCLLFIVSYLRTIVLILLYFPRLSSTSISLAKRWRFYLRILFGAFLQDPISQPEWRRKLSMYRQEQRRKYHQRDDSFNGRMWVLHQLIIFYPSLAKQFLDHLQWLKIYILLAK